MNKNRTEIQRRFYTVFEVKVGAHQGSVLSPLLYIIELEAVSRRSRSGLLLELRYTDDLALVAESKHDLLKKLQIWKIGLEAKSLKGNINKNLADARIADRFLAVSTFGSKLASNFP